MSCRTLDEMALDHGTDKSSKHHDFAIIYDGYFSKWKDEADIILVELGIGGYHYADRGDESLRMWREYFKKASIVGIDIHYKNRMNLPDVYTFQGSQDDAAFLYDVIGKVGTPDIIIDDASHVNALTIQSFKILFQILSPGGYYVIEDAHTSYWKEKFFRRSETRC
jgi:cephalosporin hydroxylase